MVALSRNGGSVAPVLDWTGWSDAEIVGFRDTWRAMATRTMILHGRGAGMRAPLRHGALTAKFAWRGAERYHVDGRTVSADDDGWLVIGAGELYASDIAPGPDVHTLAAFFDERFIAAHRAERTCSEPALLDGWLDGAPTALERRSPIARRRLATDPALAAAVTTAARDPQPLALAELLHTALSRILDAAAETRRERARLPCVRAATRDELHRRISRAHDLLMSAYSEPLDLARLAAEAAMAPHHFLRRFRDVYGTTPHRALVARRIERARHLLTSTSIPITDIACAVGFDSAAAFATRFRRDTGQSPSACRAAGLPAVSCRLTACCRMASMTACCHP